MPRVSQEYKDARREQILAAGRRCFLRDGFHATSMQDLFDEAGLSSGSVYRYFASKDDLIVAIAEDNMREVVLVLKELSSDRQKRSLGDAVAEVLTIIERKDREDGLGGLAVQVWSEALRNADIARRFADLLAELRTDLTQIVRRHQAAGAIDAEADAGAVATLLISVVAGHIMQIAVLGPTVAANVPRAASALWPS